MKKVSVYVAMLLCFILVFGQMRILKNAIIPEKINIENERIHLNTGNTIRVMGKSQEDMGIKISDILFPVGDYKSKPNGLIIIKSQQWQHILSLMPLVKQYNSPIIQIDDKNKDTVLNYAKNIFPKGIMSLENSQILLLGSNIDGLKKDFENIGLSTKAINYENTEELLEKVYQMQNFQSAYKEDKEKYAFIISDKEPLMAIPVAPWIVKNGGLILYLNQDNKLYNSSKNVINNIKPKKVYILGKKNNAGEKFIEDLENLNIPVKVISARNHESFSINFSRFYDEEEGVGWNINRSRSDNDQSFILCSKEKPIMALMGSQLSLKGKAGPILWTDKNKLSTLTENYLWRNKPNYWVTPAEGPFNNLWIIGDEDIIDFSVQARGDYSQEIEPYKTLGTEGVSGIDVLSIIFSLISLLGALWTGLHAFYRMKGLNSITKIMWVLVVLILGPVGLWLYIICYINSPWMKMNENVVWLRPLWKQSAVATVMSVAFGASSIIVTHYISNYIGYPLISFYGRYGSFLLGNPMILNMIISYIVAFLLNWFLFMPTIIAKMKGIVYKEAVKESLPLTIICITAVSLGMYLSIWWLQRVYSPVILREDNIAWFGFMQLSAFVGFLISYIPNWILVRSGRKIGIM
ncbi:DUF4396 domain-containing protein [Haloimpatiens lingqiaonensis]|uniref:DUF4396 domain-containing protein n=1 Tax=Haloimpatiens lingqiaonensis TaxID=1380675 RepID=UPI0010FDBD2A|nr:DUF4396 domain-containing protein [Haloimpatiens lingqiaonensis]